MDLLATELIDRETNVARSVMGSGVAALFQRPRSGEETNQASYYQKVHEEIEAYATNNWLIPHLPCIVAVKPSTVIEIGCGNGHATRELAKHAQHVVAVDWARSPQLAKLPSNVEFLQGDIRNASLPRSDIAVSADVLEHFDPDDVLAVIKNIHASATFNYHVIACYDDNHSHLAVARPGHWLALFLKSAPSYRIASIEKRRNQDDQLVCAITNIPSRPAGAEN